MTEQLKEDTFEVNIPAAIRVENIRGSVRIRGEVRDTIQVTATKYTDTGDAEKTEIVFEKVNDSTVYVATRVDKTLSSTFLKKVFHPCRVHYDILTPTDCSLTLECVSASAEIQGLAGEHSVDMVSGDLDIQDLHGGLKIHTVSGNLRSQDLHGRVDLSSVSGDVVLSARNSEALRIHTVSGNINADLGTINEGFNFKTVSGDIQLDLEPETTCTVQMKSFSGDVWSDLPISQTQKQIGHSVYEIQGGGPTLQIQSLSGNLRIRDKTETIIKSTTATAPAVDSMAILDQVAKGELSVDRAIDALKD